MAAAWPALAATVFLLASCATEGPRAGPGTPSPAITDQDPDELWDRSFVAERIVFDGQPSPVYEGAYVYVIFDQLDGVIRWGNCNHTGEDANIGPRRLQILQDDLYGFGQTEIGCPEELEQQLIASMRFFLEDPYWRLEGERLILTSNDSVIEFLETEHSRTGPPPPTGG